MGINNSSLEENRMILLIQVTVPTPGRGCCPGSIVTNELVEVFDNCDNVVVLSLGT